jgi:hypothetical protein
MYIAIWLIPSPLSSICILIYPYTPIFTNIHIHGQHQSIYPKISDGSYPAFCLVIPNKTSSGFSRMFQQGFL